MNLFSRAHPPEMRLRFSPVTLESPPCSIPNKVVKSEPCEEDVRLLLKTESIETPQRKQKVGDFVMLFPNHIPKIWWVPSYQTQLIRVVSFVTNH
ncbi:hypothetical protein NPIL_136201 [Nephila pilipes]|uniref:Uncharacterized protein n=1 Tax=Nephila pilipes TaxID=299642 RepID=A0A8X6R5C6_NEPPI|nr:hypothetical protein NPIL_136201 [Nephila pilipes]